MFRNQRFITFLVILLTFAVSGAVYSQDTDIPPAEIINDEGGPVVINGEVTYTNLNFTSGVASPVIILEDQAGFIDRNEYFVFPQESQTLGQITTDFYTSPFHYTIALPIEPQGSLRDVDHDQEEDTGVMVFAIAYWNNTWGDPFLEERDLSGGGWSTAYASTRVSINPETPRETVGGKYLVYAPDDEQGFPSGFGEDVLLFTEDDPIVRLPQGYTVVNMDTNPFTFDRKHRQTIDLIEPEGAALVDFGDLSYAEAFDAMVEKFRNEYAFTEYKHIDWDALYTEFRPRFEKADEKDDANIYLNNLREFIWRIPDGHVSATPFNLLLGGIRFDAQRGIGLNIRETDDNRSLVTFVLAGSPAEKAGIELGAEILSIDGEPIAERISKTVSWFQPYSSAHNLRLGQEQFATRFPDDVTSTEVEFLNPGDRKSTISTIQVIREFDSLSNALTTSTTLTGFELPVEYDVLDSGYGYVAIYSFLDNSLLTIQLWERMIQAMNASEVPGIIIDLRQNGGGNGFLADQMSAYFFDEPLVVGQRGYYSEDLNEFYFDDRGMQRMYLPAEELRYRGDVAVLVGPNCASACERIAYNFTLEDRAAIVGQYPTAGLGGSVEDFKMPLDITIRFTTGRSVDAEGNIHIEGTGIVPTIKVPVNEETLFSEGDPVLEYAEAYLNDITTSQ